MSNQLITIEQARVVFKEDFATGVSKNGPWASIRIKVEWEYEYPNEPNTKVMSAWVVFKADRAVWVRDNVFAGNPYAIPAVPDTYINLWLRTYADGREYTKKDGTKGADNETIFIGEFVQLYEQK